MAQRNNPLTRTDRELVRRLEQATAAMGELGGDGVIEPELHQAIAARAERLKDLIYVDAATSRLGGSRSHLLREETAEFCASLTALVDAAIDHQIASLRSDDHLPATLIELRQRLSAESLARDELGEIV